MLLNRNKPQRVRKNKQKNKNNAKMNYRNKKISKIVVPKNLAEAAPSLPPLPGKKGKKRKSKGKPQVQKKKRRLNP
jgi:hypothetical protein